jgi:hypothetical protein
MEASVEASLQFSVIEFGDRIRDVNMKNVQQLIMNMKRSKQHSFPFPFIHCSFFQ